MLETKMFSASQVERDSNHKLFLRASSTQVLLVGLQQQWELGVGKWWMWGRARPRNISAIRTNISSLIKQDLSCLCRDYELECEIQSSPWVE